MGFGTNIFDTLELALKDQRLDTIYLLSDGEPTTGRFRDTDGICRELKAMNRERPVHEYWLTQKDQILNRGLEVWKPVVCAVNGLCLAGGMTLLLATDIRIASEHAMFDLSEVKRGILPGNGGTQRTIRQLPYPIAMEMLLLARRLSAP